MTKLGVVKLATVSLFLLVSVFGFRGTRSQEAANFGDPLPGLTVGLLALFEEGKEDFEEVEEVDEGLGPTFNARGCAECHSMPAVGGAGTTNEVRAGRTDGAGSFSDLPGGSLFQIFAIDSEKCQEVLPVEANVIAFRQVQPLFGVGLIEAIPESAILAKADPNDRNGDGITGRAHMVLDAATNQMRVGRFGWKAQQASLLGFSADAYLNEMGITSDLAPRENAPNGNEAKLRECDTVADPEDQRDPMTGRRGIDNFENFMRLLGPPPRGPITAAVRRGEAMFNFAGCARCHTPVMQTGSHPIAALSNKPVPLFSDLLLHDIGTGDGIAQGGAAPSEIRTAPLWGLRVSAPYLHDGSAMTIEQAIIRHGNEAAQSKVFFNSLTQINRDDFLAFLRSL